MISIIVAMTKSGVIGVNGKLPWNIPEEMAIFKEKTMGQTIIMGRKTYESIGKPLINRRNIVISKNENLFYENIEVYNSLKKGLEAGEKTEKDIYIIGGGELFKEGIQYAEKLCISFIKKDYNGDTYFPRIDLTQYNKILEKNYKDFIYCEYMLIKKN